MKRLLMLSVAIVVGAIWPAEARGQMQIQRIDDPPRFAAYWEFGGNVTLSANLDVLILSHTSVRVGGFLFLPIDDPHVPRNGIVTINHLIGGHGHYLEIGAGGVATHLIPDHYGAGPTATIGYRIQTRDRFARVGVTMSPPRTDGRQRGPTAGFSLGRTF